MKRPSKVTIALCSLPFAGLCLSVPLWDRVTPTVLGVPFNLAWMMAWIALTSAAMALALLLEERR